MSMAATGIVGTLGSIVGATHVVTDAEKLRAYQIEGMAPRAALLPGTDEEVADVVRFAASEKLALVPTGARTKLAMRVAIERYDLALDMSRLDRVAAYDPADLTLSVQPGIPLQRLSGVLAGHRQFLPLAVPFGDLSTVGGTIASGVDSPLRQFYGTARDYVLGMEFVTGDGRLVKSGGRVVKNVSGYDLHKLMIGSFGSLGVITRINLRTFPLPESIHATVTTFDSEERAIEMRQRLAQSALRPLTIEILNPLAAQALFRTQAARWTLVVSFAGNRAALDRYERDLRQLAGTAETRLLDEEPASLALAQLREFIPISLRASPATVVLKIGVLPGDVGALLGQVEAANQRAELRCWAMARGVGVVYVALLNANIDDEAHSRTSGIIDALFSACEGHSGNFSVLWYPREWHTVAPSRKPNLGGLDHMRKIKQVFDPDGVFAANPVATWT